MTSSWRIFAFIVLLSVTVAGSFALGSALQAQTANHIELGLSVQGGNVSLLRDAEATIGREVDFVRSFSRWNDQFPTNAQRTILDDRDLLLSVRPVNGNGSPIQWNAIANAQPGSALHDNMVRWAQSIKPFEDQIYIAFHHEPEAEVNLGNGDADDFIRAFRAFMTVLEDEQVDTLGRTWIVTNNSFVVPAADRRAAEKWYPGDAYVDVIAADAYNWHNCRAGVTTAWADFGELIEDFRSFGLAHPDKDLMLAEFGSVEDPNNPTRKAEWIAEAQQLLSQPNYSQFMAASYFNVFDANHPNCQWALDSSPQSLAAFTQLSNDPVFGGPTPPPPPPDPAAPCTATVTANGILLEFDLAGSNVIRRNGSWLTNVPAGATSFTDPNPPAGATYEIRNRPTGNGAFTDHSCVVV